MGFTHYRVDQVRDLYQKSKLLCLSQETHRNTEFQEAKSIVGNSPEHLAILLIQYNSFLNKRWRD
jgi:hypothetical protein